MPQSEPNQYLPPTTTDEVEPIPEEFQQFADNVLTEPQPQQDDVDNKTHEHVPKSKKRKREQDSVPIATNLIEGIQQLADANAELKQQNIKSQTELKQRDVSIATLEAELKQRDASIATLEAELKQRDASIATLEAELKQRDASIATLEASNDHVRTAYGQLSANNKAVCEELEASTAQVSISYKVNEAISAKLASVTKELETSQAAYDEKKAAYDELETAYDELVAAYDDAKYVHVQLEAKNKAYDELKATAAKLQSDNVAFKAKSDKKTLANCQREVTNLKNRVLKQTRQLRAWEEIEQDLYDVNCAHTKQANDSNRIVNAHADRFDKIEEGIGANLEWLDSKIGAVDQTIVTLEAIPNPNEHIKQFIQEQKQLRAHDQKLCTKFHELARMIDFKLNPIVVDGQVVLSDPNRELEVIERITPITTNTPKIDDIREIEMGSGDDEEVEE